MAVKAFLNLNIGVDKQGYIAFYSLNFILV